MLATSNWSSGQSSWKSISTAAAATGGSATAEFAEGAKRQSAWLASGVERECDHHAARVSRRSGRRIQAAGPERVEVPVFELGMNRRADTGAQHEASVFFGNHHVTVHVVFVRACVTRQRP